MKELPVRVAAASSIENFSNTLRQLSMCPSAGPEPFELFPILYDLVVDDDEDIRDTGARLLSHFISQLQAKQTGQVASLSLSPSSARAKMVDFLLYGYHDHPPLLIESLWRLTRMDSHVDIETRVAGLGNDDRTLKTLSPTSFIPKSVSGLLEEAMEEQSVVFEKEKQNLYVDTLEESDLWTEVASGVETYVWNESLIDELETWAVDGLQCLSEALSNREDGPLGFVSNQDVFALWISVISAAEVLLRLHARLSSVPKRGATDSLIQHLHQLHKVGERKNLHPLLMSRIERLL